MKESHAGNALTSSRVIAQGTPTSGPLLGALTPGSSSVRRCCKLNSGRLNNYLPGKSSTGVSGSTSSNGLLNTTSSNKWHTNNTLREESKEVRLVSFRFAGANLMNTITTTMTIIMTIIGDGNGYDTSKKNLGRS